MSLPIGTTPRLQRYGPIARAARATLRVEALPYGWHRVTVTCPCHTLSLEVALDASLPDVVQDARGQHRLEAPDCPHQTPGGGSTSPDDSDHSLTRAGVCTHSMKLETRR